MGGGQIAVQLAAVATSLRRSGKQNVLGVLIDAIDHERAVACVIDAAKRSLPFAVSALAAHGVTIGARDAVYRQRLNELDIAVPDGQPVRWALNLLYGCELDAAVRGTDLTSGVLHRAAEEGIPVYFYGSRRAVLDDLVGSLLAQLPRLRVAGAEPSLFRRVSRKELTQIADRIRATEARIVFVGTGCPRQEVLVHELRAMLPMPLLAVGAAFDYLSGNLRQPPLPLRKLGLEWCWRLWLEPRRLWRRYLVTNTLYLILLSAQALRLWSPSVEGTRSLPGAVDA